jgi:hypothetical protein
MTVSKRFSVLVGSSAVAATFAFASVPRADAAVRVGFRRPLVVGHFYGFYGAPYFGFGYGYGPYWGPYAYPYPSERAEMGAAVAAGLGAVDMNVKPGEAQVWVDGKYVAEARDLDGSPSYLWLAEGPHQIEVFKDGYAKFKEEIDVHRGVKRDLKVRLEKGRSGELGAPAEGPGAGS